MITKGVWALPWHYALNTSSYKSPLSIKISRSIEVVSLIGLDALWRSGCCFQGSTCLKKTYSGGTSASVGSTQADSPFEVMAVRVDLECNIMCASVVVSGRSGESGLKLAQPSKYMALLLMFARRWHCTKLTKRPMECRRHDFFARSWAFRAQDL